MELVATSYQVNLNRNEIITICSTLQTVFKDVKERIAKIENSELGGADQLQLADLRNILSKLRSLRNSFGNLIGLKWMGEDA